MPKIYLHEKGNDSYDVIDGQQRIRTIWSFYDDEFALAKDAEPVNGIDVANKRYSELDMDVSTIIDSYCYNESPIVKTKAEQSFCYAPKEESGCILSKRFSGRLLLRQWRRRKKERNIHNSGCICRFALEFCNYKKERTETLYQSFSPLMVRVVIQKFLKKPVISTVFKADE